LVLLMLVLLDFFRFSSVWEGGELLYMVDGGTSITRDFDRNFLWPGDLKYCVILDLDGAGDSVDSGVHLSTAFKILFKLSFRRTDSDAIWETFGLR
jgi:hypothetical protein